MSEPNQYHTPCHVVSIIDGRRAIPVEFSDLQIAYIYCKNLTTEINRNWTIKPWETTIQLLYEYHMEDGSGIDVAKSPHGDVISIFYLESDT